MAVADDMAKAMGVHVQSIYRWLRAGLPPAAAGQALEDWAKGAREWQIARRRRTGPTPLGGTAKASADVDLTRLRAEKLRHELRVQRGLVHDRRACDRDFTRRCGELRAAFASLPDVLARRLYQAPSPDEIKLQVEEELRRCFEVLARDGGADQ